MRSTYRQPARFEILGSLRLWRGDVELDPGPRQPALLLAILFAEVERPVSRSELVELMWATPPAHGQLSRWLCSHGDIVAVGIEGLGRGVPG